MKIIDWILPKDHIFFDLLEKQAETIVSANQLFYRKFKSHAFTKKTVDEIKKFEKQGDNLVHEIFQRLNKTFIAPIDHEDIGRLAIAGDDLLDLLYICSQRILIYGIDGKNATLFSFAEILNKMIANVNLLVKKLRIFSQSQISQQAATIHALENEADDLLIETLKKVVNKRNIKKLFWEKEVYEMMESLTDKIEDYCNLIQNIIMKNV